MLADGRNRLHQQSWEIEAAALPIARQILCAAIDRAVSLDHARAADANKGSEVVALLVGAGDQLFQHVDQTFNGFVTLELLVAVTPKLEFPDFGLREVGRFLQIELDHAGANVGAADIYCQNGIEALEHPGRRKVNAAEQT